MKIESHTYRYKKQKGGRGRFGMVEIEIIPAKTKSKVTDDCQWKIAKEQYPNYKGDPIWKQSAIDAAQSIIDTYIFTTPIEIIIHDINGIYVDTLPSHIGAAIIIGIFDMIESPLNDHDLEIIDDFITDTNHSELIPDYTKLVLTKPRL